MSFTQFSDLLQKEGIEARRGEPLARYTTWRIGGAADLYYVPSELQECVQVVNLARSLQVPVHILGRGSNVLIADQGLRGLVIHTKGLKKLSSEGQRITAEAGIPLPYLCQVAFQNNLTGLEFASGIPGTLGGAVIMNAGAHNHSLSQVLTRVWTLSPAGVVKEYQKVELGMGYRSSSLKGSQEIVLQAELELVSGSPEQIKRIMDDNLRQRQEKQPLKLPNAGSVFQNPPGDSAGRLIEAAGLKGLRRGDAQVSQQHANFIVNLGKATAQDVQELIKEVQQTVGEKFSVLLKPEVVLMGFDDNRG